MFNEKNLRKLNFIFGLVTMLIYLFYFFAIQWRGSSLVTASILDINITILEPLKNVVVNLIGNEYGTLIYNIIALNLIWYVVLVFPVWVFNLVKRCFRND